MRLLLLTSLFHPHAGGAERQARALAGALRQRGVEVLVLTSASQGEPCTGEIDGIPVYRWIAPLPLGPLWGLTYMAATLAALLRLRRRYDLIHCQQLYLHTPVAALCQWRLGKPVCVRLACTGAYGDIQVMQRMRFGGHLLRLAGACKVFVAVSRAGATEAASLGVPPDRIAVIPNGVLLGATAPWGQGRDRQVLFVGALRRQKGLPFLLEAFARLNGSYQLSLVGAGPEEVALQARARELGIGARTHFTGPVEDPSSFYRRARLFVLPSLAEGLSNALLEAMAFEVPVVATRIGGNIDVVEHGVTGLLAEPANPGALAEAMDRLLTDEPLARALAANARSRVLREYTLDGMVDRYLGVYQDLLGARPDG